MKKKIIKLTPKPEPRLQQLKNELEEQRKLDAYLKKIKDKNK